MLNKLVTLYEPDVKSWSSIEELNGVLNWTELISQTGAEYFQSHGVSQTFTNEIIEAMTRVNYAQVRRTACSPWFLLLIPLLPRISTVFMDWKPQ
jgi:Prenylcysteine lyase